VQDLLHLRVVSAFYAIRQSTHGPAYFTVPKGAVVETAFEPDFPGLVPITLDDQPLFAFIRDLRERAEPVGQLDREHAAVV
jgi:hypothetical protein